MDDNHRRQSLRLAETWDNMARDMDRAHNRRIVGKLKAGYDKIVREPVPDVFRELLKRLEAAEPQKR